MKVKVAKCCSFGQHSKSQNKDVWKHELCLHSSSLTFEHSLYQVNAILDLDLIDGFYKILFFCGFNGRTL